MSGDLSEAMMATNALPSVAAKTAQPNTKIGMLFIAFSLRVQQGAEGKDGWYPQPDKQAFIATATKPK